MHMDSLLALRRVLCSASRGTVSASEVGYGSGATGQETNCILENFRTGYAARDVEPGLPPMAILKALLAARQQADDSDRRDREDCVVGANEEGIPVYRVHRYPHGIPQVSKPAR